MTAVRAQLSTLVKLTIPLYKAEKTLLSIGVILSMVLELAN